MKNIYHVLADFKISYEKYEHPAVFTVAEAHEQDRNIPGGKTKNLFLRNKKADKYYLVVVESTKRIDLKKLAIELGESKFSFGSPDKLKELLNLKPGSVSPFGLINDHKKILNVVIDNDLLMYEKVGFHPNLNTATLVISVVDFQKFLSCSQNKIIYLDL